MKLAYTVAVRLIASTPAVEAIFVEVIMDRSMRRKLETFLIIGLGGIIGANLRYLVSVWAVGRFGSAFPWGTLIINLTGSALLAVFLGWAANRAALDPRVRLLIATGFFGAYTTFSTYANDSIALLKTDDSYALGLQVAATGGVRARIRRPLSAWTTVLP